MTTINLDWLFDILKNLSGGTTGQYLRKRTDNDYEFEWASGGGGGGGTSDYSDLTNKPKINNVELSGNKTSTQLGITASALGAYVKPSGGIPKTDLAAAVQTSLGKADTALQSAPVTSVDGKTGAVTILPTGGTTGQALVKTNNSNYAVQWATVGGGGGTSDYTDLTNKPKINNVELSGNKTSTQLGITASALGAYVKPSGGIPKTDLAAAVQTSLGKADTALQTVPSTYRTAAAQDVIDAGKADKVTEVTISTAGAVTQAIDAGKIYHFTGALTSLTITASDPSVGDYQFDFISGSTAPSLTVPASWVMPDNFIVEPSARYRLSIQNGYCSMEKWSDSHSPFIYFSSASGDFVINNAGLQSDGNIYANVGTEVVAVSVDVKLKNQLADNTWLKICDVSANAKALMGSTYVSFFLPVGSGKVTVGAFNTWDTSSEIRIKNSTGAALAVNTQIVGTIFILRTL
jgi:hypothetical protein